jgi:RND family efflux transporter MFP subunit
MKLLVSTCVLAASSALIAGCNSGQPVSPAAPETVQARVVQSRQQLAPVNVSATGTIHAHESAVLSAQVMGHVQQVLVHEGDSVKAGQTLVVLDDASMRSSVDQAQAAVKAVQGQQAAAQTQADLATSTLARYQQLQAQKSVSPQEMDEVSRRAQAAAAQVEAIHAQAQAAQAQETGARTMLGYTRIRAPFAGIVTARMVDPGALASPGVPLLQVDSAGSLELQTTVDESVIANVRKGMTLPISVDAAPGTALNGTVSEIVPAADPSSHSFLVKITLPHSAQIRAGMYATAAIPTGSHQAILVPRSAVLLRGSLNCAYVLDSNNVAQLRYVTLGSAQGSMVEVLSGISAGEQLVDDPADRDLAGKRIAASSSTASSEAR